MDRPAIVGPGVRGLAVYAETLSLWNEIVDGVKERLGTAVVLVQLDLGPYEREELGSLKTSSLDLLRTCVIDNDQNAKSRATGCGTASDSFELLVRDFRALA